MPDGRPQAELQAHPLRDLAQELVDSISLLSIECRRQLRVGHRNREANPTSGRLRGSRHEDHSRSPPRWGSRRVDVLRLVAAALVRPRQQRLRPSCSTHGKTAPSQGWVPRGSAVLTNSTDVAHTGTRSLLTTGRTANWSTAPALDVLPVLSPATVYQFTASVRLRAGEPATQLIMTVQRTPTRRHAPVRSRRRRARPPASPTAHG